MKDAVADGSEEYRADSGLKVADEVWIATALLQRENPEKEDFTVSEIRARLRRENLVGGERPGVQPHIALHCVANRPPNPGRYRMLVATSPTRRRLYRSSDPYDEKRANSKITPEAGDMPAKHRDLLEWYRDVYARQPGAKGGADPILALRGLGKEAWAGENADAYVRRLRKGWT